MMERCRWDGHIWDLILPGATALSRYFILHRTLSEFLGNVQAVRPSCLLLLRGITYALLLIVTLLHRSGLWIVLAYVGPTISSPFYIQLLNAVDWLILAYSVFAFFWCTWRYLHLQPAIIYRGTFAIYNESDPGPLTFTPFPSPSPSPSVFPFPSPHSPSPYSASTSAPTPLPNTSPSPTSVSIDSSSSSSSELPSFVLHVVIAGGCALVLAILVGLLFEFFPN